jgi:glycerol-3-phosphate dehydrogenase (NAD(P)+)
MRDAVREMTPHLQKDASIISLAKGIERGSNKTMDALLAELLPSHAIALLGGPMLAAEFMQNLPGVGCVATEDPNVGAEIAELFSGTLLFLEQTSDVRGAALSGVLKNIYALGLGIASGLSWGNNQKGWYASRALFEMADIVELFGGKRETAYSLAGVGDLIATGFSSSSRNNRFGEELVKNGVCNIQSEGCASLPAFSQMLKEKQKEYPLFAALEEVVLQRKDAQEQFGKLMARA